MKLKNKKILVTGHNGFLGSFLVRYIEKKGAKIVTLNKLDGERIDIRDWNEIKNILDLDIIYHLAAQTFIPLSYKNPREMYEVNVLGTLNMLELARINEIEKFIFTSSYVYGNPQYLPIDENHPLKSMNPYSLSKILGEELCKAYNEDFGINCVILRPFNIYGEKQNSNFLIPFIIEQLKTGKIELKDPRPKRDFVYVTDVVDALIKAINLKDSFEIFNIGSGISYSVKEIVDKIVDLYGKEVEVHYSNEKRENEIMDTVANVKKAQRKLAWNARIDIRKGLIKFFE